MKPRSDWSGHETNAMLNAGGLPNGVYSVKCYEFTLPMTIDENALAAKQG